MTEVVACWSVRPGRHGKNVHVVDIVTMATRHWSIAPVRKKFDDNAGGLAACRPKAGQGSANDCLRSMACKMQVDFHPEAVAELEESADWYRQRSPNAARDLLVAVDMAIAKIAHQLVSNSDLVRAVMCFAAFVSTLLECTAVKFLLAVGFS